MALTSPKAVRFCLAGALLRAAHDLGVGEPPEAYDGSSDGDPPRLTTTATAFAVVSAGGVAQAKPFWPGVVNDEVRQWLAEDPTTAIFSISAQLLNHDRIHEPVDATPRTTTLVQLVINLNDVQPSSHARALDALDRGLHALEAIDRNTLGLADRADPKAAHDPDADPDADAPGTTETQ